MTRMAWQKACGAAWDNDWTVGQAVIFWRHLVHKSGNRKAWPQGVEPQPTETMSNRKVRELWPQFGIKSYVEKPADAARAT